MQDNPLMAGFGRLRHELAAVRDINTFDAVSLLSPFLQIVQTKGTAAPITILTLGALRNITSHSGQITSLLKGLKHRPFRLATGQIIPVLVKAEAVSLQPTATFLAHEPSATCNAPPVTSLADKGCVCATSTSAALPEPTETDECSV
ncbi:hypothetical protein HYQ44_002580 [Verticillium longisporum]|nr:hypothetical protein HYQ44_002580 [Verticillium longisporum]